MNWKIAASAALVGAIAFVGPAAAHDVNESVKLKARDGTRSGCTFGVTQVTRDYRPSVRYLKVKWWIECSRNTPGNFTIVWTPMGVGTRATTRSWGTVTDTSTSNYVTLTRCNNKMDGENWNHPFQQMRLISNAFYAPEGSTRTYKNEMIPRLPFKC